MGNFFGTHVVNLRRMQIYRYTKFLINSEFVQKLDSKDAVAKRAGRPINYPSIAGRINRFLGAFAKLRKARISVVMSVCPSVRMEQLGSHWTDFDKT